MPRGEGCVLCGDFNSPVGASEHAALLAAGDAPAFVNAWQIVHGAVPPAPTFGVHERRYVEVPACYDLFLVSENITDRIRNVVVDALTDASDHQPVLLDLN